MPPLHAEDERNDEASLFDPLTGLPKRALLQDRLSIALARAERANRYVGVMSVSVDFADLRSNQARIHAINEIAARLTSLLRPDDTAARIEGSSGFVVLCNVVGGEADVHRIANRLALRLGEPLTNDSDTVEVTITVTPRLVCSNDDAATLLDQAERAALTP